MIRATGILAALSFAAIAGAQPAKPMAKHDTTKAKAAAPAAKAAAPAAIPAAAPAATTPAKGAAPAMKHDTTKKAAPTTKKPGV